jgi:hypothetical protein
MLNVGGDISGMTTIEITQHGLTFTKHTPSHLHPVPLPHLTATSTGELY